jgi:hypothetical protein
MTSFFCYFYPHLGKNSPQLALNACASIAGPGHGSMVAPVWLVVATGVVIDVVMAVVPVLVVVVVHAQFGVRLVARVGTELVIRVIGVLAI